VAAAAAAATVTVLRTLADDAADDTAADATEDTLVEPPLGDVITVIVPVRALAVVCTATTAVLGLVRAEVGLDVEGAAVAMASSYVSVSVRVIE